VRWKKAGAQSLADLVRFPEKTCDSFLNWLTRFMGPKSNILPVLIPVNTIIVNVRNTELKKVTPYEHNKDLDVVALSGLEPERSCLRNNQLAVCI